MYADALFAAGETQAASETYELALERDNEHPESLLGFAAVLLRGEKEREARAILQRVDASLRRRIRPPALRARMLTLRGRAELMDGDASGARDVLRQATELAGVPAEAYFYLGESLSGSNSAEARTAYEAYLERAPSGPLARRARRAIR
jgi:tetratricopeptide (TPR) repeat protein